MFGMTKAEVEARFNAEITKKLGSKPEVLGFILNHERKPRFIETLCMEITRLQLGSPGLATAKNVWYLIDSLSIMFAKMALESKEQEMLSSAEKQRRHAKANELKEAEGLIAELEDEATTTTVKHFVTQPKPKN